MQPTENGESQYPSSSYESSQHEESQRKASIPKKAFGAILILIGLALFGLAIYIGLTASQSRASFLPFLFGFFLVQFGWRTMRGKSSFDQSAFDPNGDTLRAGRGGMFDKWSKTSKAIINELRPHLLATGAEFWAGGTTKPSVRVGWPGWWGSTYGAFVILIQEPDTSLRIDFQLGKDSEHISRRGPLRPSKSRPKFGYIVLDEPAIPKAVYDWLRLAESFTRENCKLPPRPSSVRGES